MTRQDGAVGETTRSVIGGFVSRLLASIKAAALNAINDAKTAVSNKVKYESLCTRVEAEIVCI